MPRRGDKSLRRSFALALCWLLALPPTASAWNDVGHRLIACIAYQQLDAPMRRRLVEVLQQHERYEQDFVERMPRDVRQADRETQQLWIFTQAAVWPDIARGIPESERDRFHRPLWHFVNLPVYLNDEDRQRLSGQINANTSRTLPERYDEQELNVIQALQRSCTIAGDQQHSPRERALHLCWVLHLAGDMHQPLHTAALYSQRRFAQGDRGGNLIPVQQTFSLHALWDGQPGKNQPLRQINNRALVMLRDSRLRRAVEADLQSLDFDVWLDESFQAAQGVVYDRSILAAVEQGEATPDEELPPVDLSRDYLQRSGRAAEQRVYAAGMRLHLLLEKVFAE